jgi:hypothetical protein
MNRSIFVLMFACACGSSPSTTASGPNDAGDASTPEASPGQAPEASVQTPEASAPETSVQTPEASAPEASTEASAPVDASTDAGPTAAPDPNCPAGIYTTVSGVVYDPTLQFPVADVTVFAPKAATLPIACDLPSFYGSAVTDLAGHFVVSDVPPGVNVPLVVQSGSRRKEFMLARVQKCVDNPQAAPTLYVPDEDGGSYENLGVDAGPMCIRVLDCTDCVGGTCEGSTGYVYCCATPEGGP